MEVYPIPVETPNGLRWHEKPRSQQEASQMPSALDAAQRGIDEGRDWAAHTSALADRVKRLQRSLVRFQYVVGASFDEIAMRTICQDVRAIEHMAATLREYLPENVRARLEWLEGNGEEGGE
jgi:hypothetical protein